VIVNMCVPKHYLFMFVPILDFLLFEILIVDGLKILLEILKFVMSYMLKYEAYIRG
jgi:hypothetical protein